MHSTEPTPAIVGDLMSRGVQTVEPDATLESISRRLRLIGHEGFPVVEGDVVMGLLNRRDADHALEHGLGNLTVREVMNAGHITMRPSDSVALLVRRMVETGWGQIPVVDDAHKLIGIVTRTDLIKYWAKSQPDVISETETVTREQIAGVLGEPVARLIELISRQAQEQATSTYMVGGVVRDLLLTRPNDDIDFVIEGDAIAFVETLRARYGGQVHSYRPFGTATWQLEGSSVFEAVLAAGQTLPLESVDFASARSEFYEHPTALPTVYSGSIKLDLQRRDFTINTLAVLISPTMGQLVDEFGGLVDLRARLIRVLHSLSFVDDPTRILRAVRFERRLGFVIEQRTAELIETALPMLRRITGERIRNELTLMLQIEDAAGAFLRLQALGILKAIHPGFSVPDDLTMRFEQAQTPPAWCVDAPDPTELRWCLLLANAALDELPALTERLLFNKALDGAILETAQLVQNGLPENAPPSQIVAKLERFSDLALCAAWVIYETPIVREQIRAYSETWRDKRPKTDGHALQKRGVKPGPCYGVILARLRAARLDGEVTSDDEETRLLEHLLEEGICNDGAR